MPVVKVGRSHGSRKGVELIVEQLVRGVLSGMVAGLEPGDRSGHRHGGVSARDGLELGYTGAVVARQSLPDRICSA